MSVYLILGYWITDAQCVKKKRQKEKKEKKNQATYKCLSSLYTLFLENNLQLLSMLIYIVNLYATLK